jgi:ankyrin repeat protein
MALSSEDAHIDAHPLTMPRNNEELDVHLRLFNDAQRHLLKAIRDDGSEADLRADLNSTLVNITDGGNEEQVNFIIEYPAHGRVRLEPGLRPRGRVYEKALEEARDNKRIEKFLLTELERDPVAECLSLNLPDSRGLKIACWASMWNFVHIVMALIHCRDQGGRHFVYTVLTIAVQCGHVELVKRLTDREEFDVNGGRRMEDFDDYLRESGNPIERVDETDLTDKLTPLNLAAKLGNFEIVDTFLARKRLDPALSPEGYWALYWAVKMGHAEVVDTIFLNKDINAAVLMPVEKSLIEHRMANDLATSFRWSGRSDIGPFCKVSLTPPQLALFYGHRNVVKCLVERLGYATGLTEYATEMWRDEIREIVMDIPDIQKIVKRFEKEREAYVHAANSITIVAALILTVTFTGFLTPPPGYLDTPEKTVYTFYIYNTLSFLSAIAALLVGCSVTRPQFTHTYIAVQMPLLQQLLFIAYYLLYFSVAFFTSTFCISASIMFPPSKKYNIVSILMTSISFSVSQATLHYIQRVVATRKGRYHFVIFSASLILYVPLILTQR